MSVMQSSRPLAANLPPAQVDSCIYFPAGLVGCSTWKRFVLLSDAEEDLPVAALQCLDERGVTFMVTDPVVVSSEYEAPLSAGDRAELGLDDETTPVVYCTLTVGDGGELTANLLGPLVINPTTRKGKQLVLADSGYSACHPVGNMGAE
ncbi:MAG: flagellar assembly protein FliW [Chloroflexi bacterium]|nr:flagellar assembly protein FliW [Chloroflexota bacterium]